jgi:hypothetical protein
MCYLYTADGTAFETGEISKKKKLQCPNKDSMAPYERAERIVATGL